MNSIADLVRAHAEERPDHVGLTCDDRRFTFSGLHARSSQAARALQAEGLRPDDRVAILDKNGVAFYDIVLGAAKMGAVNVAVNWRLAGPEIVHILNDAEAKVLVIGEEFVPMLTAIESELLAVNRIVVIGSDSRHVCYDDWISAQHADDPLYCSGPDDVAFQLYTSGTTGMPKGVMLTNRNLFELMPKVVANWELDTESVTLAPMPLFHIAGCGIVTAGLLAGANTVLLRDVDPAKMLQQTVDHGVTHLGAVPAILQFMLMVPGISDMAFPSLQFVLYGASPISPEVLTRAVATFKCKFMQMYGLTETTGVIAMLLPEDHDPQGPLVHRLGSAGRPIPGVEVKIVSTDDGEDVRTGAAGEIWCRSEQNMKGYWNKPDETAAAITEDGWLKTGDVGYLDEDDYLFIHDRVKDMIISGGENVYPTEVENVLMRHPAIADVAVVGVPSDRWGETVKAVIVPVKGQSTSAEEVIAYTREHLAHYKCPTSVDFAEVLPRNPAGKLLKREIRAPYWQRHDREVS